MSFLIKLSSSLDPSHDYEISLINAVAEMNSFFPVSNYCLGCLGVSYKDTPSKMGFLEIEHISQMIDQGYGKCDSIVAWYIMVYTSQGIPAEPLIIPNNQGSFHVKMKYFFDNKWIVLDPSVDLNKLLYQDCDACKSKMNSGVFRSKRGLIV